MARYVKGLGTDKDYVRPKTTMQEKLTAKEIVDKLKGYAKVDDISEVPLNTHLRYFTLKDGKQEFRLGGFLNHKANADEYVRLSNGANSWSVNTKTSTFYRKLSQKELVEQYEARLEEKDKEIKRLKEYIKKMNKKRPMVDDNTN